MMRRPVRLNAEFIRKIDQEGRFGDGRGSFGLSLLVQLSGRGLNKSWTQRLIQRNGKQTSIGLGAWPTVSLAEAREAAASNALAVKAGDDVLAERRARSIPSDVPTFGTAAEIAIQGYAQHWKGGGRTADVWRAMLERHVYPAIGGMRVDEITGGDVYDILNPLWSSHHAMAVKIKTALNAVFGWCYTHGFVEVNPVQNLRGQLRGAVKVQHHRALPWHEVGAALARVDASGAAETTKLALRFLALTAARSGEVRAAEWHELDVDLRCWVIPADRMKTGKPHRIPLSEAACAVLRRAEQLTGGVGLVFPSRTGRRISDGALSKLFAELAINSVPHGLRSSFRVWAAEADVPREVAEHALAHVVGPESERAYQRSDLYRQRFEVMERWAAAIG